MKQIPYIILKYIIFSALAFCGIDNIRQDYGMPTQKSHYLSKKQTNLTFRAKIEVEQSTGNYPNGVHVMTNKIVYVSNIDELYRAIETATGGDVIELAPGDYGQLDLLTTKTFGVSAVFDSTVTIRSADSEDPARFSGMQLNGAQNLTIDGVVFDSDFAGTAVWAEMFTIKNSSFITIQNSLFQGELIEGTGDPSLDGYATGKGLAVTGSSDIQILNNEFTTFHRGLVVASCSDVSIVGNDIHSLRSDGLDFVQVQSVLIEDNYIHDFSTSPSSGDHPDMIQFWTNGSTKPSTDIVIRGNTLDVGDGATTQSIFMRNDLVDRGLAGEEMYYQNILIEENVILNNHTHGITVGETLNLAIRNNTVLDADSSIIEQVRTPKISVAPSSKYVAIDSNVVASVGGYSGQADWTLFENVFVQNSDIGLPNHYEYAFLTSSMSGTADGYIVNPESVIAELNVGATRLLLDPDQDSLRPVFSVSSSQDDPDMFVFDARWTTVPSQKFSIDSVSFTWDFGDGTSATGLTVSHSFERAGSYQAVLTAVLPDGSSAVATSLIGRIGSDLIDFNPLSGAFEYHSFGSSLEIEGSNKASVGVGSVNALDIGGTGSQLTIDKVNLGRLFGADSFDISISLRADVFGSFGEIARVHNNFILSIKENGSLFFELWTTSGYVSVTSSGLNVADLEEHDLHISLDSATSSLLMYIDGKLLGSTTVDGAIRSEYPNSLVFGNPWGKANFDATITAFEIDVSKADYPYYIGDLPNDITSALLVDKNEDPALEEVFLVEVSSPVEDGEIVTQDISLPLYLNPEGIADGYFGRLTGNAFVDFEQAHSVIVLDGKNDSLRFSEPGELEIETQASFGMSFAVRGDQSIERALFSKTTNFDLLIHGDSVILELANYSNDNPQERILAHADSISDGEFHNIELKIDSESDRVQVLVDDILIIDRSDIDVEDFNSATKATWWNSGYSVGDAGRRTADFSGLVSDIWIDDQALFLDV